MSFGYVFRLPNADGRSSTAPPPTCAGLQKRQPQSALSHRDRNKFLRGLPELPVDEIRRETPQERKLLGLSWPDFKSARPKSRKRLLKQLVCGDHLEIADLGQICRQ